MAEITEQIVREAPEIEKIKLGLLQSAKALPAPTLPAYQIAGFSPEQLDAMRRGQEGIGSYLPFMQGAQTATTAGAGSSEGTSVPSRDCKAEDRVLPKLASSKVGEVGVLIEHRGQDGAQRRSRPRR